jgi:uncharacterized protein with HEPN domain
MLRDEASVLDIIHAIQNIADYTHNLTFEEFVEDEMVVSAVLYQFIIIGEATYRLSDAFVAAHPDIEWPEMRGMRNRVAHGYDAVKYDLVWKTIKHSLLPLAEKLEPLVPPEPDDESTGETE